MCNYLQLTCKILTPVWSWFFMFIKINPLTLLDSYSKICLKTLKKKTHRIVKQNISHFAQNLIVIKKYNILKTISKNIMI